MSDQLMMSVSGVRGVVGKTFTPELIVQLSKAFARYCRRKTVVLGRDSRPTGELIMQMVESALSMAGCNVVNIGIVPTPTVQVMVEELQAGGGIVVSASHNPIEWNAFKLINANGTFLNAKQIQSYFKYLDQDFAYVLWNQMGSVVLDDSAHAVHVKKVLDVVNYRKIRRKRFKVALDSVNGAGSEITQKLLALFKCKTIPIHCTIDGTFPRGAEPVPQNLRDLTEAVLMNNADIGFAQDPDADRLAIVDEHGRPIGEENTLALVTEHLLSKKPGLVVTNLSTTQSVDEIAAKYGAKVKRTKVGEINVVEQMLKSSPRIGGEGNGGIISPEIHLGRDSLAGIGYILEMMAERGKTVSELVQELPINIMKKGKVNYDSKKFGPSFLTKIEQKFKQEKTSNIDGLRIDFKKHEEFSGGWVHLRPSNTEPIFRIIAEGKNEKQLNALYKYFADMFK